MSTAFLIFSENFLVLVIKHTMAVTLKCRIRHLFTEFLTDTLVFLRTLKPAGAITACPLQAFPDHLHHFLIFIQPNCHTEHDLSHMVKNPHPAGYGFLAERVGFEPTVDFPITSFEDWLLKPLGHLSIWSKL